MISEVSITWRFPRLRDPIKTFHLKSLFQDPVSQVWWRAEVSQTSGLIRFLETMEVLSMTIEFITDHVISIKWYIFSPSGYLRREKQIQSWWSCYLTNNYAKVAINTSLLLDISLFLFCFWSFGNISGTIKNLYS